MAESLAIGNSAFVAIDKFESVSVTGPAVVIANGPSTAVNTTNVGTNVYGPYAGGAIVRIVATGAVTYTKAQYTYGTSNLYVKTSGGVPTAVVDPNTGYNPLNQADLAALGIYPGATISAGSPMVIGLDGTSRYRDSANTSADSTYQTIVTKTIPGKLLGPNGMLRYWMNFQIPNSASTKQFIVKLAGVQIGHDSQYTTSAAGVGWSASVWNKNSETVNESIYAAAFPGVTGITPSALAIDTTQAMTLIVQCKWGAAASAERITILRDHVEILYGA